MHKTLYVQHHATDQDWKHPLKGGDQSFLCFVAQVYVSDGPSILKDICYTAEVVVYLLRLSTVYV